MLGFARGSRRFFAAAVIASAGSIVFNFLTPQIIRFTVDIALAPEPEEISATAALMLDLIGGRGFLRSNLILCALGIVVCSFFSGLLNYLSRVSITKGTEGFTKRLRDALFSHIQRLPFAKHTENKTGDIIQRCTSDVETIREFISTRLIEVVQTVILVTAALVMMFSMSVPLSLVCAAFIPAIVLYSLLFYKRIAAQFLKADEAEGELMAGIQENLTAVRVVRAFGRERHEKNLFDKKLDVFTQKWIDLGYTLGLYWGVGDFVTGAQILAVVCAGALLAASDRMTLGVLLAFISYNYSISWPVRTLGRTLSELSKAGVSAARLREVLESAAEGHEPEAQTPELNGDIVFDNVSFNYGELKVLDKLSFTVPKGTVLGVLGSTGSGKSTVACLISRLFDLSEDGGVISIGGADIRSIERSHLRRSVGLVLQEPFLFSKTVRENIEIALSGENDELLRKNTKTAALDGDIAGFKDGCDTRVGERGVTLSGGQKQRVAIARTLMSDCPILIFDDSLSSVDTETEEKIINALGDRTKGKTVILISHRISTLMRADNILVLENGRAAQFGPHKDLISEEGLYRRVYKMQSDAMLLKSESDVPEKGGDTLG